MAECAFRTGAPLRGARHQIAMPRPPRALSGAPDAPSDLETRGCSLESPRSSSVASPAVQYVVDSERKHCAVASLRRVEPVLMMPRSQSDLHHH